MLKIKLLISFCLVSFVLQGCDVIYRRLDKEGGEEKELIGDIIPFERNPTVEDIQSFLTLYGYNPGSIDGKMGRNTRRAVEKFQKDRALTVSGQVDQDTWGQLRLFSDMGLIQDKKLNISLIQEILDATDHNPGDVDGKMGSKTTAAVKRFQKSHDLKVDGKIGFQTLTKLALYLVDEEVESKE